MDVSVRKKSPRAPSMSLDDAIERTAKIYGQEGRHPTSADVVAQGLGYKDSNNGRAAQMLASLKYYGLVERPKEGYLAVSKDFEAYHFAPDARVKREYLLKLLATPPVFAELLAKYESRLPSDATIKFDLIQKGFSSATADTCVGLFRRSVEYVKYYDVSDDSQAELVDAKFDEEEPESSKYSSVATLPVDTSRVQSRESEQLQSVVGESNGDMVRIPIRLPQNRQAWLEIPIPFYEADKKRLKAHIDLQLTDDEGDTEPDDQK
ncbi:UNVERIFIED_ORG: hypothetical protein ABIC62_002485 [Burkholderia sp. 1595]|uniref:Uncharacterized protein n=1 Tax=Paraburkholderia terricola TaxID=169427 RepID=A0ABU1LSF9_9BURK|nr:hypothetical protein [Paraburkholderia terricola]MDR6409688.1 hypothetical protein [Paraburkholderia terricola]